MESRINRTWGSPVRVTISRVLGSKVATGAVWYSLAGLATNGMNVLLLPLLTRWMTPAEYGVLGTAQAVLTMVLPLVTVGLGSAVVRYYHEYHEQEERFTRFFSSAFFLQSTLAVAVAAIIMVGGGSGWLAHFADLPPLVWIAVGMVALLHPPRDIGNQLLTGQQNHKLASTNQFVSFAFGAVITALLVGGMNMGATGRLFGMVTGSAVAALMLTRCRQVTRFLRWTYDRREARQALSFGMPFLPYAVFMAALGASDRLILGKYVSMAEVGMYSANKAVAMGMFNLFSSISRSWTPRFIQLRQAGDNRGALTAQWSIFCYFSLMLTGFVALYPVVVPWLVDERYLAGMETLPLLAFSVYLMGVFALQSSGLNFLKKTKWLPAVSVGGLAVAAGVGIGTLPKLGILGVALGLVTGYLVINLILAVVTYRYERRFAERILIPLIWTLVAVVISFLIESFFGLRSHLYARIGGLAVIAVGQVAIWRFGSIAIRRHASTR